MSYTAGKLSTGVPSSKSANAALYGGILAPAVLWVISVIVNKEGTDGLAASLVLTPLFLGAIGAMLYGFAATAVIGITKLLRK